MQIQLLFGNGKTPFDHTLLTDYARMVTRLHHPSLWQVLDVCVDETGQWVLVFPELIGKPLSLSLTAGNIHDLAAPCSIALSLIRLFQYLHESGFRNRFFFDWDECVHAVQATDNWYLVVRPPTPAHFSDALSNKLAFNPRYTAPEQINNILEHTTGQIISLASDTYTGGVVLFELFTGKRYIQDEDPVRQTMSPNSTLPQLTDLRPDLPKELSSFVMQALSHSPENRPPLKDWSVVMEKFGGYVLPPPPPVQTGVLPAGDGASPNAHRFTSVLSGRMLEGIRLLGPKDHGGYNTLFTGTLIDSTEPPSSRPPVGKPAPVMPPRGGVPLLTTRSDDPHASVRSVFDKPSAVGEQPVPIRQSAIPGADPVDCSVMAPPSVAGGAMVLVQVFLHTPDQAEAARALAQEFDADTKRLGYHPLEVDLERGSQVMIELTIPKLEIDEPVQKLVWQGRTTSVQFGVSVPQGLDPGALLGKVTLHLEGVPVGSIRFKLEVVARNKASLTPQRVNSQAHHYQEAFISYSSKDRDEVIKRVQMLERCHVRVFQDILNLDPGMRWEKELYRHIDSCDVFMLFWSCAAKESQWVDKEVRYALARRESSEAGLPEIVPVLIEGPPVPLPPEHLSDLHFNDRLLYFMKDQKKTPGAG